MSGRRAPLGPSFRLSRAAFAGFVGRGNPADRSQRSVWLSFIALLVAVFLSGLPAQASERIPLGAGDTVSVVYSGVGAIISNVAVDEAGMLQLEWMGTYPASGRTILELQDAVKASVDGRVFRHFNQAGDMELLPVTSDDIWLRVDAWRGVTIYGSVMEPGEFPYRRDLSVRALIGLAGGTRLPQMLAEFEWSPMQRIDLRERYYTEVNDRAKHAVRLWGIELRLDPDATPPLPPVSELGITEDALASLVDDQKQAAALFFESNANQKRFLNRAYNQAQARIKILREQRTSQVQIVAAEEAEEARVKELISRSLVPEQRLIETRRTTLLSASRLLEIEENLNRAEQIMAERARDISRFEEERVLMLLEEREAVRRDYLTAEARMNRLSGGLDQMTLLAGSLQLTTPPDVTIHRQQDGVVQALSVDLDTPVLPGDIVEVSLDAVVWPVID